LEIELWELAPVRYKVPTQWIRGFSGNAINEHFALDLPSTFETFDSSVVNRP